MTDLLTHARAAAAAAASQAASAEREYFWLLFPLSLSLSLSLRSVLLPFLAPAPTDPGLSPWPPPPRRRRRLLSQDHHGFLSTSSFSLSLSLSLSLPPSPSRPWPAFTAADDDGLLSPSSSRTEGRLRDVSECAARDPREREAQMRQAPRCRRIHPSPPPSRRG